MNIRPLSLLISSTLLLGLAACQESASETQRDVNAARQEAQKNVAEARQEGAQQMREANDRLTATADKAGDELQEAQANVDKTRAEASYKVLATEAKETRKIALEKCDAFQDEIRDRCEETAEANFDAAIDPRLIGLTGINIVTGNEGNDVFVFTAEQTTITDFEDGFDQIDVSALAGIDSFDDVNVVALGSSVKLVFAEGTITMLDTTAGELDATDFIF